MVHPMGVYRDRTADREDVRGLHRLDREARVNGVLNVVPAGAGADDNSRLFRIQPNGVHVAHVEHDAAAPECVAAHAVTHSCRRNRESGGVGIGQRLLRLFLTARRNHAGDRRAA